MEVMKYLQTSMEKAIKENEATKKKYDTLLEGIKKYWNEDQVCYTS